MKRLVIVPILLIYSQLLYSQETGSVQFETDRMTMVFLNDVFSGVTNDSGLIVIHNLYPGMYSVRLEKYDMGIYETHKDTFLIKRNEVVNYTYNFPGPSHMEQAVYEFESDPMIAPIEPELLIESKQSGKISIEVPGLMKLGEMEINTNVNYKDQLSVNGLPEGFYPVSITLEDITLHDTIRIKKGEKIKLKIDFIGKQIRDKSFMLYDELGNFTDARNNRMYNWVRFGNTIWMAENLNFKIDESCDCYEEKEEYCKKCGRLYLWEIANNACPVGWYLPSDEDWQELEMNLGMTQSDLHRTNIRGVKQVLLLEENGGSKFNARKCGFFNSVNSYNSMDTVWAFWSSTQTQEGVMWRMLDSRRGTIDRGIISLDYDYRLSVRCVTDRTKYRIGIL